MKKSIKRIVSLALVLVMVVCLSSTAFAASKKKMVYVTLGDSIAAGYGPYNHDIPGFAEVPNTYPSLVKSALGAHLIPLAYSSIRSTEIRYMLDSSYSGDEYNFYMAKSITGFDETIADANRWYYQQSVAKADLITLNTGSNDVLLYVIQRIQTAYSDHAFLDQCRIILNQAGTIGQAYGMIISLYANIVGAEKALATVIPALTEGTVNAFQNITAIIQRIYALNPDVELLVVGMYNPFETVGLTDYSLIKIGAALSTVTQTMNAYMKLCCNNTDAMFVDTMHVETCEIPGLLNSNYLNSVLDGCHPTLAGHKDIAERILAVHEQYVASH